MTDKTEREKAQTSIAENRKALHDFHMLETFEAGMVLLGTEVKAIREGRVNLRDSFARVEDGEVYLYNVHISPYSHRGYADHEPLRRRKLLLHRNEILKLVGKTVEKGMTLVPVRMYFKNGRVKVAVSLAKGKKEYDKRETIKRREVDRETRAAIKERRREAPGMTVRDGSDASEHTAAIPLLDLRAQYAPLREEILAAVTRVCDSQRFIMGPEIEALEQELSTMLGVRHAVAVSSGTDALLLALMALGIKTRRRSHHLCRIRSSRAPARSRGSALRRCSSTSTSPRTTSIPARVRAAITPRTKAILPVHLFGLAADMDPIVDAASRAGFPSSRMRRRRLAPRTKGGPRALSDHFGCFSFFPSKNLGAFGDAGLLDGQR